MIFRDIFYKASADIVGNNSIRLCNILTRNHVFDDVESRKRTIDSYSSDELFSFKYFGIQNFRDFNIILDILRIGEYGDLSEYFTNKVISYNKTDLDSCIDYIDELETTILQLEYKIRLLQMEINTYKS